MGTTSLSRDLPSSRLCADDLIRKTRVTPGADVAFHDFFKPKATGLLDIYSTNLRRWYSSDSIVGATTWQDLAAQRDAYTGNGTLTAPSFATTINGHLAPTFTSGDPDGLVIGDSFNVGAGAYDQNQPLAFVDQGVWGCVIKTSATPFDPVYGGILIAQYSNGAEFKLGVQGTTGLLEAWVNSGPAATSNVAINDGNAHTCYATWDGSTVTLYVDGVAQTTTQSGTAPPIVYADDDVSLGCGSERSGVNTFAWYDGQMGEPFIANILPTADQLALTQSYLRTWANIVPPGALSGTANATTGGSASLSGSGALSGSTVAVGGQSATLKGAGALAGSTAAVAGQSGALSGSGALAGTSAAVGGQTGSLKGAGALAGTSSAVCGQSGSLTGAGVLAGTADATCGQSGALTASGALAGTCAATAGQSGALTGAGVLAGSAAAVAGQSGALVGSGALAGAANATTTQTGNLGGGSGLAGSSAAAAGQSGTLTGAGALTGSSSATTAQSGTLAGSAALAGTSNATTGQSGSLGAAGALSGLSSAFTTAIGALTTPGLGGQSNAITAEIGTLLGGGLAVDYVIDAIATASASYTRNVTPSSSVVVEVSPVDGVSRNVRPA